MENMENNKLEKDFEENINENMREEMIKEENNYLDQALRPSI